MANSIVNTNLNLTIQDQLAITGGAAATLVTRAVFSQFLSTNSATYSGYQTINSTAPTALVPVTASVAVCFVRLASGADIVVNYKPGFSGSPITGLGLSLGNIFLFASSGISLVISNNFISNVSVACANTNTTSTFEFLVAY